MDKAVHICTGTCRAEISEEEYNKGLVKCGAQGCTHFGHAFEKRIKCNECQVYYKPGEKHLHLGRDH